MGGVLPPTVERSVGPYVADVDRLLPGRLTGFYVVGSVALGAYRERRSDIDFVAVLDGDIGPPQIRRLRLQHVRSGLRTGALALRRHRSPTTGTCNGVFIRRADISGPVGAIVPVAAHVAHNFTTGRGGSDVSPVAWKVLAERGIACRGPEPSALPLDSQPDRLVPWNLENLERYWRPFAAGDNRETRAWFRARPRWSTAWGVLGAPRLHRTIATGDVISKEEAGEYALDVFPARFHPLIGEALAYWREEPPRLRRAPDERRRATSEFVLEVIDAARALASSAP
jgi:hypothetical protein